MDWAEELKMSIRKTTARKGRRSRSRDLLKDTTSSAQTSQSLTSNSTNNRLIQNAVYGARTKQAFYCGISWYISIGPQLKNSGTASEGDLSDLTTPSHHSSQRPERHSSDLFLPNVHLFRNNRLTAINIIFYLKPK
uniref:Uncharacterized protein n=1 Tax=Glossina palpalis gambiensis TaxID=67801 RepID=A0A1B0B5L9_9MUSC